jgi:NADH-quinone oxidoreductase subunit G
MDCSDVLLPIAPFTETSGTFINAEGRVQSFHAVVKPLGETRPAWKVLRVLANLMDLPGFDFESSHDVLTRMHAGNGGIPEQAPAHLLSNACYAAIDVTAVQGEPCVAGIYALDGIVRRAPALQQTADARASAEAVGSEGVAA